MVQLYRIVKIFSRYRNLETTKKIKDKNNNLNLLRGIFIKFGNVFTSIIENLIRWRTTAKRLISNYDVRIFKYVKMYDYGIIVLYFYLYTGMYVSSIYTETCMKVS